MIVLLSVVGLAAPLRFPSLPDPAMLPQCSFRVAELAMSGDIMMHLPNLQAARRADGHHDLGGWFDPIAPLYQHADLALVNFETNIAGLELDGFAQHYTGFPRFNSPPELLDALREAGVDVLQHANNHALDRGIEGLRNTLDAIDAAGLDEVGSARSRREREQGAVLLRTLDNGMVVGILAYTFYVERMDLIPNHPWSVDMVHSLMMVRDIRQAREHGADVVWVGVHWGEEYRAAPFPEDQVLARRLVAAGADVVFGTHPHVVGPAEVITVRDQLGRPRDGVVVYSAGNTLSHQRTFPRAVGVLPRVRILNCPELGRSWVIDARFTPFWVDRTVPELGYQIVPNPPAGGACLSASVSDADCTAMQATAREVARWISPQDWSYDFEPSSLISLTRLGVLPDPYDPSADGSGFRYLPLDAKTGPAQAPPAAVWSDPFRGGSTALSSSPR